MLPATLVTFTTFLLKLCNTSPIYNMQPAFITNTVGATTGRNIRNLPCISRRNSNQSGFCMFAIDCLKANGTHLGTCIDGFYFGSCCYIEPVRDITDNTIDTDIIPHREPPFRISSTTMKTTTLSTFAPTKIESTTIKSNLSTSTIKLTTFSNVTNTQTTSIILVNLTTPATTTGFQKLQTFQLLDGSTIDEISTKASIVSTTNGSIDVSMKPITVEPVIAWSTKAPDVKKPTTLDSKINSTKTTTSQSLLTVHSGTTEKATGTKSTTPIISTVKPTKVSLTKSTSKPSKPTYKPSRTTTPSKRPDITPSKKQTTSKPTKKTNASIKPTKKIITTPAPSISTAKVTTTTEKSSTTQKIIVINQQSKPIVSYSTTERINATANSSKSPLTSSKRPVTSTKSPVTSTKSPVTLTKSPVTSTKSSVTSTKSPVTSSKIPATVSLVTMSTPNTLSSSSSNATKTEVGNKNVTTVAPDFGLFNVTTEDWVPITTPDGWVLLSNAANNKNESSTDILMSTSSQASSSSSLFTTTPSSATSGIEVVPVEVSSVKINTTVNISTPSTTVSSTSSVFEISSSSSSTSPIETLTVNPDQTVEPSHILPVNMSDFTDVCGRRMYPEARIVGGEKSSFGKWPWQISLRQWRTSTYLHKCGAALLNENWAITAAHCVDNVPPSDLLLRLGEYDLSTESEPYLHEERRVQIVASHPQFDPRTFEYDLALLRFYEPVNFQPNILPVCVPQNDENFVSRTAYVTGWGRLYEDGPLPSILQEVSVPVINNTVCESMYRAAGYIEHIPHIFICAGWRRGGFDSCEGDSGGPMVIQRPDKRFLLAGVISWGIGCAEPNQPGVYTRISEFRDWINQILQF